MSYSIRELMELKAEYLSWLDDSDQDDHYDTMQGRADKELRSFFAWLNIRENTP